VLYEMLTGDLPIGKFAPPSSKVEIDVRLDEIVLRALENDPALRYQQASEVKQRLEHVSGTPGAATFATPSDPAASGPDADQPKPGVRYLRWLGIPVVVERDGVREASFNGAMGLIFVVMAVAALAHQSVRWIAGTEHSLSRLVLMAGTVTMIWAFRRTLNQPPLEPPVTTGTGTVILPRSDAAPTSGMH